MLKNYMGINLRWRGEVLKSEGLARVKPPGKDGEGPLLVCSVFGLPDPKDNILYLVSSLVFAAAVRSGRRDVCTPSWFDEKGAFSECPTIHSIFTF